MLLSAMSFRVTQLAALRFETRYQLQRHCRELYRNLSQRFVGNRKSDWRILISAGASSNLIGTDGAGGVPENEGNLISGNQGFGVQITGAGTANNTLGGNLIGLNVTGDAALGNTTTGVIINGSATNSRVGNKTRFRNVISGNGGSGILVGGTGTDLSFVVGNFIGTNVAGTAAVPNGGDGVIIQGGAGRTGVGVEINATNGNLISWYNDGVFNGSQNLISGNALNGVRTTGTSTSNYAVIGNYIGTNVFGTAAIGNGLAGVQAEAQNSIIGLASGSVPTALPGAGLFGNVISGNATNGVVITGTTASNVRAFGNLIGLAADGVTAVPNVGNGVVIQGAATNARVGNFDQANGIRANVISGNTANGILITGVGTNNAQVYGNKIGTTVDGLAALPNSVRACVWRMERPEHGLEATRTVTTTCSSETSSVATWPMVSLLKVRTQPVRLLMATTSVRTFLALLHWVMDYRVFESLERPRQDRWCVRQ